MNDNKLTNSRLAERGKTERKPCPNCEGAGCFVCLPEFATDEPGENDPALDEQREYEP